MQYGTNTTPLAGADTAIRHDAHVTLVGDTDRAPNADGLLAYRAFGRNVRPDLSDVVLGRCDDVGDRSQLHGQPQVSIEDDALTLQQSASGARQAGCLCVQFSRERTNGAGMRSFAAAITFDVPYWERQASSRIPELGDDYAGVTLGVLGSDGRGAQVVL